MSEVLFRCMSRFVAMAGIGGIAQTVSSDIIAQLGEPDLSDAEFAALQAKAEECGYELTAA